METSINNHVGSCQNKLYKPIPLNGDGNFLSGGHTGSSCHFTNQFPSTGMETSLSPCAVTRKLYKPIPLNGDGNFLRNRRPLNHTFSLQTNSPQRGWKRWLVLSRWVTETLQTNSPQRVWKLRVLESLAQPMLYKPIPLNGDGNLWSTDLCCSGLPLYKPIPLNGDGNVASRRIVTVVCSTLQTNSPQRGWKPL